MATRVEVGSIASLRAGPSLSDISREETLKRTYFCQAGDIPGAPTTRVLSAKSSLQTRLSPLPGAPRPFLKEQVPERKASVKSLWPGTSQPCLSAQTAKEEAKVDLSKKMPSLAGEEADRGEDLQSCPSVPNKATFLRSGPSTMVLFETTKAGPSLGKGTCEGSREASSRATQVSLLSARPEVATKPAVPARKPPVTLPRPTSLSQDPGSTVSQGEAGRAQPLPKAHSVENPAGQAPEAKPQPKRRPMSAVYSEYSESSKPGSGEVAVTGKVPPTPPEKTWVRRPRPLSVDLTSIFESGDTFLKKVATEQSTAEHQGPERTSMEPRGDAEGPARMDATPQDPDSDFQELAKRLHARREKMVLKQAETDSPRTPRARATPGDDQSSQEEKAMSGQQSEKVQESPSSRPERAPGLTEVKGGRFDQEAYTQIERKPTGSVRKRLSLFGEDSAAVALAVASEPTTPVTLESQSTAPEPSRAGVNVQARIKGWTAENTGEKPEVRRRVPQARPLPSDLTKPFSRTASSNEIGHEKCATLGGELPGERREKLKERHDLDAAPATKSPWKNGVPQKSKQTELKGTSEQENPDRCWGARPAGDAGPSEVSPEDDGSFQKVWATVFEHHVERHTVADQANRCLSTTPPCDVADTPLVPKPRPENWPGKEPPGVADRRDRSRWSSDHADPGMLGRAALADVERRQYPTPVPEMHPMQERHSRSVPRHLESSPVSQRVQPRYDIVHASGERAHSEAVSRVPEEKAVTLRSGRSRLSLPVRQLSQEVNPTYLECSLQANGGAVQRASLIWEARGKEGSGQKLDCHQTRDGFGDTCQSPKWTGRGVASWHGSAVVSKDLSTAQRGPTWNVSSGPPSRANIEPCDSQVQTGPDSLSPKRGSLMVASEDNPRLAQVSQPEVRMRRSNPSEPRVDRLRRRTLPHDAKFDPFNLLVPESATKRQQRPADGLTSPTCALQRPPLSHQQAQTQEVTPDALQGRTFLVEKQGLSAEPTATFFAVTYQVPDIQKVKSVIKSGTEDMLEPSRKTPPPLSPRSVVSVLASPGHEEPWSPVNSKGSAKGREYEETWNLSKHPKSTDQPTTSAGDRTLDLSRDRIIDVDALWLSRGSEDSTAKDLKIGASSDRDAPQTSPVLRQRPRSLLVRRRTEVVSETFPGKMRDGYRSSVLDLDALMAEYKERSSRITSKTQQQQDSPPAEPSSSPQERSGWPKEAEWRRRSLKEAPQSDSVGQQAGRSVKALHSPGPSKQPAEPLGAAMTTKSGLPLWAPPHSAPGENCPSPSAVPAGSRRKSPGIAEFESKPSSSEHQGTKHWQNSAKSQEPGSRYPVSPGSPPSDRKKGTPRRSTGQGVEGNGVPWGTPPRDSGWSPLDIKRACSEKGPPARIREGLSVMQDARQRRQEQSKGKPDLPATETPEAAAGPCQRDSRRPEGPKASLQNLERRDSQQDSQQPQRQVSPVASVPRRSHSFCKQDKRNSPLVAGPMEYLGDKLSVAQTHMTQWVGTVRRSFQEALHLVTATVGTERNGESAARTPFKRTSSFRHLASRSRESFRRFSARSQQRFSSLRKRQPDSEAPDLNQLKQCFSRRAPEAKDTDTLVQEADSQYGTWADQHQNGGSFGPESPSPDSSAASVGKQPPGSHLSSYTESTSVEQRDSSRDRRSSSVDRSSSELESTDGPEGPPPSDVCPAQEDDFSFIHQTSVLDSSALKTRVQLSKRSRRRAPISHSLRRSQFSESESRSPLEEESHSTWMFKDSTEEKSPRRDESDEEPPRVERTPVSHPQRMPVFPGMDPAVLKAQLPKRSEVDSPGDSLSWTPQPKSPKSPFHPGVLGSRVLPSSTEKEERSEECSPQWLKELKSKKRQSLYENQA